MVQVKEQVFPDRADQKSYEDKIDFYIGYIPALDSHVEWFDETFWRSMIKELAALEVEFEALSRQIRLAAPELDMTRIYTTRRKVDAMVTDRRDRLGISATKMKQLRPKGARKWILVWLASIFSVWCWSIQVDRTPMRRCCASV